MTQFGEVLVLKDANEPGDERPLSIIASQDRKRTLALAGKEITPELGDGFFLPFGIARKQADGPETQRVDEQAIGAVGASSEQRLPGVGLPLQTGAGQKPIHGVQVLQKRLPGGGFALGGLLGAI